jgi:hypothetical protein
MSLMNYSVGSNMDQAVSHIRPAARWWYTFRMRPVWCCVSKYTVPVLGKADSENSWLVYKIVDIIRHRSVQHRTVIATGILTNVLVIISVLSAFPWIRKSV